MINDRSSLSLLLAVLVLIAAFATPAFASADHAAEAPAAPAATHTGGGSADLAPQPEHDEIPLITKIWAGMAAIGLMLACGFVAIGMKLEMDAKKKGASKH